MRRRAVLAGVGAAALGGCGFHPLYMPASGRGGVAETELSAIYIPVLPERTGQLMRQALQQRVEGSGYGVQKRYELTAYPNLPQDSYGILADSSTTRYRVNGSANWTLRRLDTGRTVLSSGTSRITDGYNVFNNQFFASDIEGDEVRKRVIENLADQIVTEVAIYFKRQAAPPPG